MWAEWGWVAVKFNEVRSPFYSNQSVCVWKVGVYEAAWLVCARTSPLTYLLFIFLLFGVGLHSVKRPKYPSMYKNKLDSMVLLVILLKKSDGISDAKYIFDNLIELNDILWQISIRFLKILSSQIIYFSFIIC